VQGSTYTSPPCNTPRSTSSTISSLRHRPHRQRKAAALAEASARSDPGPKDARRKRIRYVWFVRGRKEDNLSSNSEVQAAERERMAWVMSGDSTASVQQKEEGPRYKIEGADHPFNTIANYGDIR
jgi:hypothetical protein